jgi:hypothetical protein
MNQKKPHSTTYCKLSSVALLHMVESRSVGVDASTNSMRALTLRPFHSGFDRLMSILCKTQSIRDVIAFPKTSAGTDPLFKSPATVTKDVLSQYGIQGIRT